MGTWTGIADKVLVDLISDLDFHDGKRSATASTKGSLDPTDSNVVAKNIVNELFIQSYSTGLSYIIVKVGFQLYS
jgi:hypothetical protein